MKCSYILAGALALLLVSADAFAIDFGDPAAGKDKASACFACHGQGGNSTNPNFPKLAGQHADYLLYALKAYKSGDRQNAIMNGQASKLSLTDMKDLAAYFASQQSNLQTLSRD